jgi:histone H3/H4
MGWIYLLNEDGSIHRTLISTKLVELTKEAMKAHLIELCEQCVIGAKEEERKTNDLTHLHNGGQF